MELFLFISRLDLTPLKQRPKKRPNGKKIRVKRHKIEINLFPPEKKGFFLLIFQNIVQPYEDIKSTAEIGWEAAQWLTQNPILQ